jgi:tRNA(Ile)-lysidine synthase
MVAVPTPPFDRDHIRPGDRICAAVSGGADSVALLLLLHALTQPRNALGVGLSAVHVHHGLRGAEADGDLAFVQGLCDRLEVPLHTRYAETAAHAAANHETIEEAGRTLRYACFRELLATGAADSILTAHTLEDQAETVLMKLIRGAWTEGISGIHPVVAVDCGGDGSLPGGARGTPRKGRILRPLLGARRAELREFLQAAGQPWREDASNADESFTRNRLRHTVLPMLRAENPAIDRTLANLATLAREEEARWQAELARTLPQLLLPGRPVRGGGRAVSTTAGQASLAIEVDRLRALDPSLRRRVVRAAARELGVRLSFDDTARLLALAGLGGESSPPVRPGAALHLPGGLRAERSVRELHLLREPGAGQRKPPV